MLSPMAAVSFQIKGVNGGFTEVNGLLSLGKDRLLMEFEKADAIVGFFRSGATSVGIEFTCIRDLVYKKGFLSAGKITLRTKSIADLSQVPGSKSGSVILTVKRADHADAETFDSAFQMAFSEFKLGQLYKTENGENG